MKGIVLAGGNGTRLFPLTSVISKQLLPIFDKPMIYYPLSVLMLAGIRDILLITTERDLTLFKKLLGDGCQFGLNLSYETQDTPNGIAEAIIIAERFINNQKFCLILGDNIFWGGEFSKRLQAAVDNSVGATIFGYDVSDPRGFGVINFDSRGEPIAIVEKPSEPESNTVATGLYFYDQMAIDFAKELKPSVRGELEISDVNKRYLDMGLLNVQRLGRGYAWLDTGTHENMLAASSFVQTIEERQGLKIACLEEIALRQDWVTAPEVIARAETYGNSSYTRYLLNLVSGVIK